MMNLTFLGTGAAWGVPEVNCDCTICRGMRAAHEKRDRTSILLELDDTTVLVDCGPDARQQFLDNNIKKIDAVLITHEHNDHYIGLDELFVYKRIRPKGSFSPIPVYLTADTLKVVYARFAYLENMEVVRFVQIEPGNWFKQGPFSIFPFKTDHGTFAGGSVGFLIEGEDPKEGSRNIVYTSDFVEIPDFPPEIVGCDHLIMQSFWLNEPVHNRPSHMSFQRAMGYIEKINPKRNVFLVHMGDADRVPGDAANGMLKKYEPKAPLKPPGAKNPYPIPCNQWQWQETVDRIAADYTLSWPITVAHDGLCVTF